MLPLLIRSVPGSACFCTGFRFRSVLCRDPVQLLLRYATTYQLSAPGLRDLLAFAFSGVRFFGCDDLRAAIRRTRELYGDFYEGGDAIRAKIALLSEMQDSKVCILQCMLR